MPRRSDPIRPRPLREGARVALVAPAGPVDDARLESAIARCRTLGLEAVVRGVTASPRGLPFLAAPDEVRLAQLQSAFDDESVDAVWALRGGYGTLRILDRLRLDRQSRRAIPFIGFSDNTTIHVRHTAIGIVSFHGPHPGGPFPPETEDSFRRTLFTSEPAGRLPVRAEDPPPVPLSGGRAEGPLYGGNLALLAALCGSPDTPTARDRILVLEDVAEPAYRVDRMLRQLERAGVLDGVIGIACGRFSGAPGDDGRVILDVLGETARRLRVPAVADLPFGHVDHNATLPLGIRASLDADAAALTVLEAAVSG